MKQLWSTEELVEGWPLGPEGFGLLPGKIEAGKLVSIWRTGLFIPLSV